MNTKKAVYAGVGAALAVALAAWVLQPRPVVVEVGLVTKGPFEQVVADDGRTRVRDRYVVSAPLAARVERITLRAGDPVERGAVVAWLTPVAPPLLDARTEREMRSRIAAVESIAMRARAERLRAEAQRDQARADRDRSTKLASEGFVSPTAREQSELALRTAERAVESAVFAEDAARHDLEQARATLARYQQGGPGEGRWKVVAPVSGAVLKVLQESESVVAMGAPLVEIADPRSLEAVVDILSQEAVAVRPGMAATLDIGQGVAPLSARVRLVEPAAFTKISALGVEEQRVNAVLDFTDSLQRVQTVGDGFRVDARIVTRRVEDGVKVPVGALFRDEGGWALFAIDGRRAAKRAVKVAMRNGVDALVESGVQPGDRVVVYPSDSLRDGARIEVRSGTAR